MAQNSPFVGEASETTWASTPFAPWIPSSKQENPVNCSLCKAGKTRIPSVITIGLWEPSQLDRKGFSVGTWPIAMYRGNEVDFVSDEKWSLSAAATGLFRVKGPWPFPNAFDCGPVVCSKCALFFATTSLMVLGQRKAFINLGFMRLHFGQDAKYFLCWFVSPESGVAQNTTKFDLRNSSDKNLNNSVFPANAANSWNKSPVWKADCVLDQSTWWKYAILRAIRSGDTRHVSSENTSSCVVNQSGFVLIPLVSTDIRWRLRAKHAEITYQRDLLFQEIVREDTRFYCKSKRCTSKEEFKWN